MLQKPTQILLCRRSLAASRSEARSIQTIRWRLRIQRNDGVKIAQCVIRLAFAFGIAKQVAQTARDDLALGCRLKIGVADALGVVSHQFHGLSSCEYLTA